MQMGSFLVYRDMEPHVVLLFCFVFFPIFLQKCEELLLPSHVAGGRRGVPDRTVPGTVGHYCGKTLGVGGTGESPALSLGSGPSLVISVETWVWRPLWASSRLSPALDAVGGLVVLLPLV